MPPPRGTFGAYVVIDPAKLDKLLKGTNGPVARSMMERGYRVKTRAQQLVGVYKPPHADAAASRARRPGTLRDSIVTRLVKGGKHGLAVIVGSHDPIALWHHEGTVPHRIVPVRAKRLRFWTAQQRLPAGVHGPGLPGSVVYSRGVNHPGTQPNRYLVNALPAARS